MESSKSAAAARFAPSRAAASALYDGSGGNSLAGAPGGFASGSLVQVPAGLIAVERLAPGDLVLDEAGTPRPIFTIRQHHITSDLLRRDGTRAPVLIRAGAFGRDMPRHDLAVGAGQGVRGTSGGVARMLPAKALVNGASIQRMVLEEPLTLFEIILLPGHAGGVRAHGLCCACPTPGQPMGALPAAIVRERIRLDAQDCLAASDMQGRFESAARWGVAGWAFDPARPEVRLGFDLVRNGAVLAQFQADSARPDLAMAGLGEGCCAFAVRLDPGLSAVSDHVLYIRGAGGGADLRETPVLLPRVTQTVGELARALDHPTDPPDALALARKVADLLQARAAR